MEERLSRGSDDDYFCDALSINSRYGLHLSRRTIYHSAEDISDMESTGENTNLCAGDNTNLCMRTMSNQTEFDVEHPKVSCFYF